MATLALTKDVLKAASSYSRTSERHKKWVLDLATRLRAAGIDVLLDGWDLEPGSGSSRSWSGS